MPGKIWATEAQLAYLALQMPEYIRRQAQKKLSQFWGPLEEGWFSRFPEQAALGYPLPSDPTAPPLTQAQLVLLGKAIERRKNQLKSWIRRERLKMRSATTGKKVKKLSPLALLLRQKKTTGGRRLHHPVEFFQKKNKTKIRSKLTERGHDELNEAARRKKRQASTESGDEDEETLEQQEKEVTNLRKARMRLRTEVVKELWAEALPEERAEAMAEVEREKEELKKLRKQERDEDDGACLTPTQYQEGVDSLDELFETAHTVCLDGAGWVGVSLLGGPTPRLPGGETTVKVISSGETLAGNTFQEACADFQHQILGPWKLFVDRVFSLSDCQARAIEASVPPSPPPSPEVASGGDALTANVAPIAPSKPKRVPKPKKAATMSDTSNVSFPPTVTTSGPAQILAPPAASSSNDIRFPDTPPPTFGGFSSYDTSSFSFSSPTPAAWNPRSPSVNNGGEQGPSLEDLGGDDFAAEFLADLDEGRYLPTPRDPFSAFDTPADVPDLLDVEDDVYPEGYAMLGSNGTASRWGVGLTNAVHGGAVTAGATAGPAVPHTRPRPIPIPSYKGAPAHGASRGTARDWEHSAYAPSVLFSAFSSPRKGHDVPLFPLDGPASMRRKLTGWASPEKQTGPTHAARALTSLLGSSAPSPSTSSATRTPPTTATPASTAATLTPSSPVSMAPPPFEVPTCRPAAKPLAAPKKPKAKKKAPQASSTTLQTATDNTPAPEEGEEAGPRRRGRPRKETVTPAEAPPAPAPTEVPAPAPTPAPTEVLVPAPAAARARAPAPAPLDETTNQDLGTIHQMRPVAIGTIRWNRMVEERQRREKEAKAAAQKAAELAKGKARGYFEGPNPNGPTPTITLTRTRAPKKMFDGTLPVVQKKNVRKPKDSEGTMEAESSVTTRGKRKAASSAAAPPAKRTRSRK